MVRCWTFEPLASTQLPAWPSAGISALDHLTSSGVAAAGLEVEIVLNGISSKVSAKAATAIFAVVTGLILALIVNIWQILTLL